MEQEIHELILPILDEENTCLPLPINVVSKYWNIELSLAEAQETAKKYSGFDGSILIEGIESAERNGLSCKILRSSLSELKKIIDAGIPPIVILPGIPEITQHASIITGYNDEEKTILHYIQKGNQKGEQQEGAIPQEIFEKEWNEEGQLLIVLAPSEIISSITFENDSSDKSNRLCFNSERSNILNNSSESIEYLQKAIQIDPNNSTAFHLLGSIMNSQNLSDCIKNYEQCLEINNKSYLTFNGLGNFYLKTNEFEKAENSYTKAIEINPKRSAKIYKNRAFLREKKNKNSDAKDDLKSYLKYFPQASDRGIIEQAIREL
ncbi:MAG: tetratricopeptide repeat protein [Thaumarchaeota archaeon]|nr:tetratricopeptide repeat protein [Nitrososphaerota archaeon]MBT5843276.1 tetratricopeptide repeat protein [Nitrososphaerota archaeon]MBT6468444.1 tetratricopeptide repeat protein [Nitrososphaerota archaeon]